MASRMVMSPMTSRDPKGQTHDPNTLRAIYISKTAVDAI